MVGALSFTSIALALGLAWSLWQLVTQTRRINSVRLELRAVIEHVKQLEIDLKVSRNRNAGYKTIVDSMRRGIIKKNEILKKHNVKPGSVIDGLLSGKEDGSET
tara:strand:+ start:324 stop:635 length:312 start_codon:yes stop_codon:yes gene_type:complete